MRSYSCSTYSLFHIIMNTKDFSKENLHKIQQGSVLLALPYIEFLEYKSTLLQDVDDILTSSFTIPKELRQNIIELIEYNCTGGKMVRGLFTVYCTYAMCKAWDEEMKKQ